MTPVIATEWHQLANHSQFPVDRVPPPQKKKKQS